MSGSIPKDFIREIVDMTDIVSLVESYLPLKKKVKTILVNVLFVMMEKIPHSVSVTRNNFIIVLNVEPQGI